MACWGRQMDSVPTALICSTTSMPELRTLRSERKLARVVELSQSVLPELSASWTPLQGGLPPLGGRYPPCKRLWVAHSASAVLEFLASR